MSETRTFTGGAFAQNGYLAWQKGRSSAIAIDPGGDVSSMIAALVGEGLTLEAILLTHAHIDHIEGVATLHRHTAAPIYLHTADQIFYDNVSTQAVQFGLQVEKQPPVNQRFEHNQKLSLAGIDFTVKHVPGHSPGHVILIAEQEGLAFIGDVVFQNSIGRTDLPGGNFQQLMSGIRDHVMTLPANTVLYSGHGPSTTVLAERTGNPFIAPLYGGSFA